jgi:hypothetical protein
MGVPDMGSHFFSAKNIVRKEKSNEKKSVRIR